MKCSAADAGIVRGQLPTCHRFVTVSGPSIAHQIPISSYGLSNIPVICGDLGQMTSNRWGISFECRVARWRRQVPRLMYDLAN